MKHLKKLAVLALALALVLALALPAWAIPAQWDTSWQLGDEVTYTLDKAARTLRITGVGPTWDFTSAPIYPAAWPPAPPFYKDNHAASPFSTVVIEDGVTYLGTELFAGNNNLRAVLVPASVTALGDDVFLCYAQPEDPAFENHIFFYGDAPILPDDRSQCLPENTVFYHLPGKAGWEALRQAGYYRIETFSGAPFADVPAGTWYSEAVRSLWEKGLVGGTGTGVFSPAVPLNRAMVVTMLYRFSGEKRNPAASFSDVGPKDYCAEAVAWAAERGIVKGYPDGTFRPWAQISRAELTAMLYRCAKAAGQGSLTGTRAETAGDWALVPDYARAAFRWAVEAGVVKGTGNGLTLDPAGTTDRAQGVTMLARALGFLKPLGE